MFRTGFSPRPGLRRDRSALPVRFFLMCRLRITTGNLLIQRHVEPAVHTDRVLASTYRRIDADGDGVVTVSDIEALTEGVGTSSGAGVDVKVVVWDAFSPPHDRFCE